MSGRDGLRAADLDRQAVADRLRRAHDVGRLDFAEFDLRLGRACTAVSYADLDALVADLPPDTPTPRPPSAPAAAAGWTRRAFAALWTVWACVVGVDLVVWMLVSLGNGRADYFWPMWLLIPGTVLATATGAHRVLRR